MSKTDQAFIDAYRRQSPKPVESATTPSTVKRHTAHGPHLRFTGGAKAPLSQVMQARTDAASAVSQQAATHEPAEAVLSAPLATIEISSFAWPEEVRTLVADNAAAFAGVVEGVMSDWPVLGLVGSGPGCGSTTTVMALACLLASEETPVAIIDADPIAANLAGSLGFKRNKTMAETLATGASLADATLHAADDGVSLLVAGQVTQHPAVVREAIHQLRQTHAAVLIDLGANPRRLALNADAVALVHRYDESDAVVEYSCRSLSRPSTPLVGTIQTLAPAA